jgi:hypothetical protein
LDVCTVNGLQRALDEWKERLSFARENPDTVNVISRLIDMVQDGRCTPWPEDAVMPIDTVVSNPRDFNPWHCFMYDMKDAERLESDALPYIMPADGEVRRGLDMDSCDESDGPEPCPQLTTYIFGEQIRGRNPRLINAMSAMLTAHCHPPGYFTGRPDIRPFRRTPFAGIAEIPATPDGFGRARFTVPSFFGSFVTRASPLPNHAFHISATVTPAGFATNAHADYYGAVSLLAHFTGAKLWITCPRTPLNALLFDQPEILLGENLPIMTMLDKAERLSCQIIDTPCAFALDPFEYHAVICLSTAIHAGGPVYCANSVPYIIQEIYRMVQNLASVGISPEDAKEVGQNLHESLESIKELSIVHRLPSVICAAVYDLQTRVAAPHQWGMPIVPEPDADTDDPEFNMGTRKKKMAAARKRATRP